MTLVRRTWHGDEFVVRGHRANGRAILGMGESVAREMTGLAHVGGDGDPHPGLLKMSIHVAVKETMGEVHANAENVKAGPHTFQIEVGSWVPYACVENNRGGAHRFADLGWQLARPEFDGQLKRAWKEEGL